MSPGSHRYQTDLLIGLVGLVVQEPSLQSRLTVRN